VGAGALSRFEEAVNIQEGKETPEGELEVDNRVVQAYEYATALADRLETAGLGKKVTFMSGSAVVASGDIPWGGPDRASDAYDMEASAFLTAVSHFNETSTLRVVALGVCKGVSDAGDAASRADDKDRKQRMAADAAVHAVVNILR